MPKAVNHSGYAINTIAHSAIGSQDLAHCALDHCDTRCKCANCKVTGSLKVSNMGALYTVKNSKVLNTVLSSISFYKYGRNPKSS